MHRDRLRWFLSPALISVLLVVIVFLVAPSTALAWTWPADGPVLRPFSAGPDPYAAGQHRGIDIGAELGRAVLAPAGGTVTFVGFVPGGGRSVTITTDDGYAVTLLQLGATTVVRDSTIAEGAEVGVVGESADAVTSQPHVHLGIRVASDPNGYLDPLGLLPILQQPSAPPPVVAPPEPVEAPSVVAPVTAVPPAEVVEPEAVAEPVSAQPEPVSAQPEPVSAQPEPPRASQPHATAGAPAANQSARPAAVERRATRPSSRQPGTSGAALPKMASGSVAVKTPAPVTAKRARVATESSSPAGVAPRVPRRTSVPRGAPAPQPEVRPRFATHAVFDRFTDAPVRSPEQSDRGDSRDGRPVLITLAATVLLALGSWLARRRYRGTRDGAKGARMMTRHEFSTGAPEDPRRGRVAVCERPTTHRPRSGIWRPGGHLRPLPPITRKRRPHGQRDRRARHARHGRRRSSGRLAA